MTIIIMLVKTSALLILSALVVPRAEAQITTVANTKFPSYCITVEGVDLQNEANGQQIPCAQGQGSASSYTMDLAIVPDAATTLSQLEPLVNIGFGGNLPITYSISAYQNTAAQCFGGTGSISGTSVTGTLTTPNGATCDTLAAATNSAIAGGAASESFQVCFNSNCVSRRRRLLDGGIAFKEGEPAYEQLSGKYLKKCSHYDYEASLFVDNHLSIVAKPPKEAIDAGCPYVATHSKYDIHAMEHKKEVIVWEDDFDELDDFFSGDSYPLGKYKGAEVVKVFEDLDLSKSTPQGKMYDLVTNNCATYLLAFAKAMNFEVDAKIKAFVARRLFQSSTKNFVDRIRDSVNFKSMFNANRNLRVASDEQVVELLVEGTAAGFV